jgi:glycosyltransferase involved in cell wall biosynthesis
MTEQEAKKGDGERRVRARGKTPSSSKRSDGPSQIPRRILMTTDTIGGSWAQSLELARVLRIFGINTVLAVLGPPPSAEDVIAAQEIPGLILLEANFRLEWMPDAGPDIERAGAWLLDLETEFAPDIVHLNAFAHAVLPWRAPCLVAIQGCLGTWWPHNDQSSLFAWSAYPAVVERALKAADLVVTSTAAGLARLQHQYGSVRNGRVIAIGRDPGDYIPATQDEVIATGLRCFEDVTNIAALDAIACRLPWPVFSAGSRETQSPPTNEEAVRQLGKLPLQSLRSWLSRASIFALPARAEPLDSMVLEAAYAGCALVLGDIAPLRETWSGAAVFVSPDDREALAAELNSLIADPGRRRVLSRLAARRARKYTAVNMARGYMAAYSEMLSRTSIEALDRARSPSINAIS